MPIRTMVLDSNEYNLKRLKAVFREYRTRKSPEVEFVEYSYLIEEAIRDGQQSIVVCTEIVPSNRKSKARIARRTTTTLEQLAEIVKANNPHSWFFAYGTDTKCTTANGIIPYWDSGIIAPQKIPAILQFLLTDWEHQPLEIVGERIPQIRLHQIVQS